MHLSEYQYIHSSERRGRQFVIPELDRQTSSANQFIELTDLNITLNCSTAFLYVDGFSIAQAESGLHQNTEGTFIPAVKLGSSYIAHQWIKTFRNTNIWLEHVNVISSTCAAGVQAVKEADGLLASGKVDRVIIIGGERTTPDTARLFKELRIPVMCGDGFVYMSLVRGNGIHRPVWKYAFNANPFKFSSAALLSSAPNNMKVDYVKLHDTGSKDNTEAEKFLEELATPIKGMKARIGHTQGISALLETCMVLDNPGIPDKSTILTTANGMGGYYGSFLVHKNV